MSMDEDVTEGPDVETGEERGVRADERWHGQAWQVERHRNGEMVTLAWRNLGQTARGSFRHLGRRDALALADALRDAARGTEEVPPGG